MTMNLNKYVKDLNYKNVYTIHRLLQKASVEISFWGSRKISIKGYKGSINLNAFTKKLLKASKHASRDELSLTKRIVAFQNIDRIRDLTNTNVKLNCIQKIFFKGKNSELKGNLDWMERNLCTFNHMQFKRIQKDLPEKYKASVPINCGYEVQRTHIENIAHDIKPDFTSKGWVG